MALVGAYALLQAEPSSAEERGSEAVTGWNRVTRSEPEAPHSEAPHSEAPRTDKPGFVVYRPGSLPIILTVAHDGTLKPSHLADREDPGPRDTHTRKLAAAIDDALFELTGRRAHRIESLLHRAKLDPNRELEDAAQGDPEAQKAWRAFHRFVNEARQTVEARFGAGLLLDLHGLSAGRPASELGVLLTGEQLARRDEDLSDPSLALRSSVRTLVGDQPERLPELLRGPHSLGARLGEASFPVVPSPSYPVPARWKEGEPRFFSGGYITRHHGSRELGCVDAIQIEAHARVRRNPKRRRLFARALAEGVLDLFEKFHGRSIGGGSDPSP